jgi:hypothetical protein
LKTKPALHFQAAASAKLQPVLDCG